MDTDLQGGISYSEFTAFLGLNFVPTCNIDADGNPEPPQELDKGLGTPQKKSPNKRAVAKPTSGRRPSSHPLVAFTSPSFTAGMMHKSPMSSKSPTPVMHVPELSLNGSKNASVGAQIFTFVHAQPHQLRPT